MLGVPDFPPQSPIHGTVVVNCEGKCYLIDASMSLDEPLSLGEEGSSEIGHRAGALNSMRTDECSIER